MKKTKPANEQTVARRQYAALAKHYGQIGNAAVRAALIYRKPAAAVSRTR